MERDRDRDRNERGAGKRAYEEAVEEDNRRYELELRRRLEFDESRNWCGRERPRSPERRREDHRPREDLRHFEAGSSAHRGPARGDGRAHQQQQCPVKRYKAKTPSAQVHSAPIPSAAVSSHTEVQPPCSGGKKARIKCYNCSREGHYQSGWKFPVHCSICEEDGHTTGMCPVAAKPASLQWYDYAVDGVGFHCLEMDDSLLEASAAETTNGATVIINDEELHVKLTPSLLEEDLKKMVEENWDWRIRQLSETDFVVVFPTASSLRLCMSAKGMELPVSKVTVIFAEPRADPRAEAFLTKIWVKLFDVPDCLRKSELLLEETKMIGRPRLVDDESLPGDGPVRMLFHLQAPSKLPPSVLLFANLQGFRIRLVSSLATKENAIPPPPPPPPSKDGDDDEETEDQSRSEPHWNRAPPKEKDPSKDKAVSSKNQTSQQNKDGAEPQEKTKGDKVTAESIYIFKKGYFKVGARKHPSKQSVGSSSVPFPSALDNS
ncbi:hypothetical protein ACQ4PT_066313 [Festuca glaucescens]